MSSGPKGTHLRCVLSCVLAVAFSALVSVLPASAAGDRFTPLVAQPVADARPVTLTDGRRHLAYELLLINSSTRTIALDSITALAGTRRLGGLHGPAVARAMKPYGSVEPGRLLRPGESGFILMDLTFRNRGKLPVRFDHRVELTLDPASDVVASRYRTGPVRVKREVAMTVAPPLRGSGWIVGNGCCSEFTSHRSALLGVNGGLHETERFAIDFIQVQADGKLLTGPFDQLSSYPFFGDPILSATRGKVVRVVRHLPETPVTGELPPVTAADAGGNFVVVRAARGRYAFYAHMQPRSATVRAGQRVKVGQVLGRLGSTGNSNAPHLHFHMMDGPSPLGSNGVPYTFSRFRVQGRLNNFGGLFEDETANITPRFKGPHAGRLPQNSEVVDFGR